MSRNPFIEARAGLPSAISTLPLDYLDGHAAQLLLIVEELKRSFLVELGIIQTVKQVDLGVPDDELRDRIGSLTAQLEDYAQYTMFDKERTHCHNIDRIARTLTAPHQLPVGDRSRVEKMERLLAPLREADNEFLDDLEPLVNEIVGSMRQINDHVQATAEDENRIEDAQRDHDTFVNRFDEKVGDLRRQLIAMNSLANELLSRL